MGCSIINFYKFVGLSEPQSFREAFKTKAKSLNLLGTVLLAPEGINCALAGTSDDLSAFVDYLKTIPNFSAIEPKWSSAPKRPFRRLEVKVKRWIIRFAEKADPAVDRIVNAARMSPAEVNHHLRTADDDFLVIDTRNEYETEVGTFAGAVRLPIKKFTEFPEAFLKKFADKKDKTILFYCTGGVRCEKVVPWAVEHGFSKATQLDGGILKYFEQFGSESYQGECFVFDDRWQVDGHLEAKGFTAKP